jgi:hypothetical protein
MKPYFPTKELEEENDRLVIKFLEMEENIDNDVFIEKYASNEFKQYLKDEKKRIRRMRNKGILV